MVQKLNKCTYQVFALIYYGDVVNPFCFLCKLPNLHIWFGTNILIQYGKHHCAMKNAKKWFCEILELLTFCAEVTSYPPWRVFLVLNLFYRSPVITFNMFKENYHFPRFQVGVFISTFSSGGGGPIAYSLYKSI